jgi:hypothetical protein
MLKPCDSFVLAIKDSPQMVSGLDVMALEIL